MSSPSEAFECHWRPSRLLLAFYLAGLTLALAALGWCDLPGLLRLLIAGLCLAQAAWTLPRQVLLTHPQAFRALRHDQHGWQLWSARSGWQPVQLRPDSLALPWVVVLRFRPAGARLSRGLCILRDGMSRDAHRRLRVRLKFSRNRWAVPG